MLTFVTLALVAFGATAASEGQFLAHQSGLLTPDAAKTEDVVVSLQPVLEKLKGLDPKTFGLLSGMLSQASGGKSAGGGASSFLQYARSNPAEVEDTLEKLGPILDRLKNLDPKAFGAMSGLLTKAAAAESQSRAGTSLLQRASPDAEDVMTKLGPVLEKLRGLDPKAFGAMSGLLSQAEAKASTAAVSRG
eukprot:TRINITY_DN1854_c0_g1_i1.p2 TRINITY_DN1854_c0_g1~~TRINITY_DN1854_c0_g1_i1.p2  ORF type:complete len:218 (+),score=48.59 TRINITY_DN1854_c0_g1_i1:83-655(+)